MGLPRPARVLSAALVATLAVGLAGCTSDHHPKATKPTVVAATNRPIGVKLPAGTNVLITGPKVLVAAQATPAAGITPSFGAGAPVTDPVSPVFSLTPAGQLLAPVTLTFKLAAPVATDGSVVMATAESAAGPWTLEQTQVSPDGRTLTVANVGHFSLWGAVKLDLGQALSELKDMFLGPLTGDVLTDAAKPSCGNESGARSGYTVKSSTNGTLYWCFGIEGGQRVLKIVNRRRYPLEVQHPGLTFLRFDQTSLGLEQLAHWGSGSSTILPPFREADFKVNIATGGSGGVTTSMSGPAQALYQLQVGFSTATEILGRFGAGGGTVKNGAINMSQFDQIAGYMGKALQGKDCYNALQHLSIGELLADCMDPQQLYDDFGWKGFILSPFIVAGNLLEFFRSEFNALGDQLNGRDKYIVALGRASGISSTIVNGRWIAHGGGASVNADGTGEFGFRDYGCLPPNFHMCDVNEQLNVTSISSSGTVLQAKVVGITYTVDDLKKPPANYHPYRGDIGRTYTIQFDTSPDVAQYQGGLLEFIYSGNVIGVFCNLNNAPGKAADDAGICGA